jgi:hypothetical protein
MDNLPRQIIMLEEAPLESLVDNIPGIWAKFISEVAQNISGDR